MTRGVHGALYVNSDAAYIMEKIGGGKLEMYYLYENRGRGAFFKTKT